MFHYLTPEYYKWVFYIMLLELSNWCHKILLMTRWSNRPYWQLGFVPAFLLILYSCWLSEYPCMHDQYQPPRYHHQCWFSVLLTCLCLLGLIPVFFYSFILKPTFFLSLFKSSKTSFIAVKDLPIRFISSAYLTLCTDLYCSMPLCHYTTLWWHVPLLG